MEQTNPLPNPSVLPKTPTNPPAAAPNNSKRLTVLIVLFIIIVVVGIGSYALETKMKPTPTATPIPIAVVKPTPIPDPTAGWKTYINKEYNYQLKFPSDWTPEAKGDEELDSALAPIFNSPCNYENGDICAHILFSYPEGGYKEGANLESYFGIDTHIESDSIISRKMIKIDGIDALEIKYHLSKQNIGRENQPAIEIKAVYNKNILMIQYNEQSKKPITDFKYETILDQILSTFKFLDQNQININIPGTEATLSGVIKKTASRPAPDIAYDYEILLDKPLTGITTGQGENQTLETVIIKAPSEINLANYVGKQIIFTAVLEWGYSESRVLAIKKILD